MSSLPPAQGTPPHIIDYPPETESLERSGQEASVHFNQSERSVIRVADPVKQLPVSDLQQGEKPSRNTRLQDRLTEPAVAQNQLNPSTETPVTAKALLSTLGKYSHRGEQGGSEIYRKLFNPDIPYSEVKKLAWQYQKKLPLELDMPIKAAWASRKAMDVEKNNPDLSKQELKQTLINDLKQKNIPNRLINQAVKTIDPDDSSFTPVKKASRRRRSAFNHTPSMTQAKMDEIQKKYNVTVIPLLIDGKPVAYRLTRTPDNPKETVMLSCHAGAWGQRPKTTKPDDMLIRFAAPRKTVLRSRTVGFGEAFGKGQARFKSDPSQLYNRDHNKVTDYYLGGDINCKPEDAARLLAKLDQSSKTVNPFDIVLLDRNVSNLHFSDVLQALKESGNSPKQLINHCCRAVGNDHSRHFEPNKDFSQRAKRFSSEDD